MNKALLVLVFKAWLAGLLFTAVVLLPMMTITRGGSLLDLFDQAPTKILNFLSMIPSGLLMVFSFGLIISFPLFIIASIVAFSFKNSIANHRLIFSVFPPLLTAVLAALRAALTRDNDWANSHSLFEKFGYIILTWDTWIIALPVFVAATYFCISLPKTADRI